MEGMAEASLAGGEVTARRLFCFFLAVPSWLCRVLAHRLFSWEKQSVRFV